MALTVNFWYRNKYRLTSNDPRYLNTTELERLTDYWACKYLEDPNSLNEIEDTSFDMDSILAEWEEENAQKVKETARPDEIDDWETV